MTARRLATADGLNVRFELGDAERLGYGDASFDVVASAQGTMSRQIMRLWRVNWLAVATRAAGSV